MDILNFISWIKGGRVVTTVDPTQTLLPVGLKDGRRDDGYLAGAITVTDLLALVPTPPGGLTGTNYVYVAADGTDVENAIALQAAYIEATTMSPSVTNRITVIAAPGYYNFGSTMFTMNTQYIDLVSLDGNRSIIFNSSNANGTINITANDVFVKGVDVQMKTFMLDSNLNLLKVENCKGGDSSFGGYGIASGIFTNCQGGDYSFGGSFGGVGIASGTFTNCIGLNYSFGKTASGTFTDCKGGERSFGGGDFEGGTASGTFTNCIGANFSFGGGNSTASGTFNDCIGGDYSFGGYGTASGTFTDCKGGNESFGGGSFGGTLSGFLYYCRLTAGTFQTVSGAGITRYCLDGTNTANNQG